MSFFERFSMPFKMLFSSSSDEESTLERSFVLMEGRDGDEAEYSSQQDKNGTNSIKKQNELQAGQSKHFTSALTQSPENPDLKVEDPQKSTILVEPKKHFKKEEKPNGPFLNPRSFGRDFFVEIFSRLTYQDILRVQQVCKYFYAICNPTTENLCSDLLWQNIFERNYAIPKEDLDDLKKHKDLFSYRQLVKGNSFCFTADDSLIFKYIDTPTWSNENLHMEIELDETSLIAGKRFANSNIGVAQARMPFEQGKHVVHIQILDGGDSCVLGFTEMKFEIDENRKGNMKSCVGNYPCKNWGVTGWGTFWSEGQYNSNATRKFTSGDRISLLLDLDDGKLIYFKNGEHHGTLTSVSGKLYLTVTMRQTNRVMIIPTIHTIALRNLKKSKN
jgi:hypothetical protein